MCFLFSLNSLRFSLTRETNAKKLLNNDKIYQITNFAKCFFLSVDLIIQELKFSPISQLLLCQFLSWEDLEKNKNTKSEPVKKWNSILMPNTLNRGKNSFSVIYVVKDLSMKKRISNIVDFRQIYFGSLIDIWHCLS